MTIIQQHVCGALVLTLATLTSPGIAAPISRQAPDCYREIGFTGGPKATAADIGRLTGLITGYAESYHEAMNRYERGEAPGTGFTERPDVSAYLSTLEQCGYLFREEAALKPLARVVDTTMTKLAGAMIPEVIATVDDVEDRNQAPQLAPKCAKYRSVRVGQSGAVAHKRVSDARCARNEELSLPTRPKSMLSETAHYDSGAGGAGRSGVEVNAAH